MSRNTDFAMPDDKDFKRWTGHLNTAPLLMDDPGGEDLVIKGIFDDSGEFRTASVVSHDSVENQSDLGVVVLIKSHTDDLDTLKERWRRRALAASS